jgi:hypothetical protein
MHIPPPRDTSYPGTIEIHVDAADTAQGIFRVHEVVRAHPDDRPDPGSRVERGVPLSGGPLFPPHRLRPERSDHESLDTFARSFFGIDNGSLLTRNYTFDDLVGALNGVVKYDEPVREGV